MADIVVTADGAVTWLRCGSLFAPLLLVSDLGQDATQTDFSLNAFLALPDFMATIFPPEMTEQLLKLDFAAILLQWMGALDQLSKDVQNTPWHFFSSAAAATTTPFANGFSVPPLLGRNLLRTWQTIREHVHANPVATAASLVARLYPDLARLYAALPASCTAAAGHCREYLLTTSPSVCSIITTPRFAAEAILAGTSAGASGGCHFSSCYGVSSPQQPPSSLHDSSIRDVATQVLQP